MLARYRGREVAGPLTAQPFRNTAHDGVSFLPRRNVTAKPPSRAPAGMPFSPVVTQATSQ